MKQTVFNKLYHRIQHEPKIYGLTFPQLMLVMLMLLIGYQLASPLGLLLSIGGSFGLAAGVYVLITRRAKALEGLGNDKFANQIRNCVASNEYSGEFFEILGKKESNHNKKGKKR